MCMTLVVAVVVVAAADGLNSGVEEQEDNEDEEWTNRLSATRRLYRKDDEVGRADGGLAMPSSSSSEGRSCQAGSERA